MSNFELELDASLLGIPLDFRGQFNGDNTAFSVNTDFTGDQQNIPVDDVLQRLFALFNTAPFITTGLYISNIEGTYTPNNQQLDVSAKLTAALASTELFISLKEALIAGANLDFNFDLADIPLIEEEIKQPLQVAVTFGTAATQNYIIPNTTEKVAISKGIALKTNLKLPNDLLDFNYQLKDFTEQAVPPDLEDNLNLPKVPKQKMTMWFKVYKNIGPVSLNKIGLQWKDKKLWVLLNMDIDVAGLQLSLLGLKAGSSLKKGQFSPKFDVQGVGLFYQKGVIEIGGAFFKVQPDPAYYLGKAVFRVGSTSIAAVGGYGYTNSDKRSLFALASIGVPLGGVPFFFVTGLAAGFGYNSRLVLPATAQVADYPLLQVGNLSGKSPTEALAILGQNVKPSDNNRWFAAGVHFTSFGLLKSTALILYDFEKNQFNFLGVSRLILPNPKQAYLNLRLGMQAVYRHDQGVFKGEARLAPGSYIFSDAVKIDGGAACYAWLDGEHEGDFVLTIGGYHPKFQVPSYYPTVPKVQFNWAVSDKLKISGNTYFALTSSSVMAGFQLDAAYQSGSLKAWFSAATDMLLQWKPFYYDLNLKVRLGAAYQLKFLGSTKNYKLDIGANFFLFGPPIGGYVKIDWKIISFTIRFGSLKSGTATHTLDWATFSDAFLPSPNKICQTTVSSGLIQELETTDVNGDTSIVWVLDQENLALATNSVIPTNTIEINGTTINYSESIPTFGIRPMNKRAVSSTQKIWIRHQDTQQPVKANWITTFNETGMAANLWSPVPLNTKIPKAETIETLSGFSSLIPQTTQFQKIPFLTYQEGKTNVQKFNLPITDFTDTVQSQTIEPQFLSKQLQKQNVAAENANSLWLLEQTIMDDKVVNRRNDVVTALNDLLDLQGDDVLVSGAMDVTKAKAELEFQSEIKIGAIQPNKKPVSAVATSSDSTTRNAKMVKSIPKPPVPIVRLKNAFHQASSAVSALMTSRMKAVHQVNAASAALTTRGIADKAPVKNTSIVNALKIKAGNSYTVSVKPIADKTYQLKYDGKVSLQVLAFNKDQQLIDYQHIQEGEAGHYILPLNTVEVNIKGLSKAAATMDYQGWQSNNPMSIINGNALLGNGYYIQLQSPIPSHLTDSTTLNALASSNKIQQGSELKNGWIDTVVLETVKEFVVIVRQKNVRQSNADLVQDNLTVSIPCVMNDDFQANFSYQKQEVRKVLQPRSTRVDKNGNVRIKYSLNQKYLQKATKGLTVRIQTDNNWQTKGLCLFKQPTQQATWLNCQLLAEKTEVSTVMSMVEIE